MIELGDVEVGKHAVVDVAIFNLDPALEAGLSVQFESRQDIVLVSAPTRIRPSREGSNPDQQLQLLFQPAAEGHFETSLTVHAGWQYGGPAPESVIVKVRGAAHAPGTQTWQERTAQAEARRDEERRADTQHSMKKRIDDNERAMASHNVKDGFFTRQQRLSLVYEALFDYRRDGLEAASELALGYRHRLPPEDSKLAEFARLGIDLATALIGGGVGKAVEQLLKSEKSEGEIIVAAVGDAVKEGTTEGAKGVVNAAIGSKSSEPEIIGDNTAAAEFFRVQKDMLVSAKLAALDAATGVAHLLVPLYEKDHDAGDALLDGMVDAINRFAPNASRDQQHESIEQWVRYVAHASLGGQPANESLTNVAAANQAPNSHGSVHDFDGLVDIHFTASPVHPEEPAEVAYATLTGIKKETVKQISMQSLLSTPIPIRAVGAPRSDTAVLQLAVVRDEAGTLSWSDDAGVSWMPARWFERKGGGDAREGAKLLMTELLTKPLRGKLRDDDNG